MGEECSSCRTCFDQHEIRSNETRFTGTHIITNNNKNNIKVNVNNTNNTNNTNNLNNVVNQPKINSQKNPLIQKNNKPKHKFRRKEGRKSTLDSMSFNEQKKNEFEEELRISLCSMKEKKKFKWICFIRRRKFLIR